MFRTLRDRWARSLPGRYLHRGRHRTGPGLLSYLDLIMLQRMERYL